MLGGQAQAGRGTPWVSSHGPCLPVLQNTGLHRSMGIEGDRNNAGQVLLEPRWKLKLPGSLRNGQVVTDADSTLFHVLGGI